MGTYALMIVEGIKLLCVIALCLAPYMTSKDINGIG